MDGLQIERVLHKALGKTFKGVFSFDEWKKIPRTTSPAAYVFNTLPSDQNYGHWFCVFITRHQKAIFFDSFGRSPIDLNFDGFLKRHSTSWRYSNVLLQNPFTAVCGQHVIVFLIKASKGCITSWLKLFTNDLLSNDQLVCTLINEKFLMNTSIYPGVDFIM